MKALKIEAIKYLKLKQFRSQKEQPHFIKTVTYKKEKRIELIEASLVYVITRIYREKN